MFTAHHHRRKHPQQVGESGVPDLSGCFRSSEHVPGVTSRDETLPNRWGVRSPRLVWVFSE